ncbi:TPA: hypothetical protein DCE37_13600 [Candidatus Latescibacteria bacterium]|nr:hypothetical protein [Candidatus Latescibacterota bacterium]
MGCVSIYVSRSPFRTSWKRPWWGAIRKSARKGESAEGVILVPPISRAIKIRTGFEGEQAIMPNDYFRTEADLIRWSLSLSYSRYHDLPKCCIPSRNV